MLFGYIQRSAKKRPAVRHPLITLKMVTELITSIYLIFRDASPPTFAANYY